MRQSTIRGTGYNLQRRDLQNYRKKKIFGDVNFFLK
jgi:hypothetical protein